MEMIVGRKGEQPFEIADKSVSGKHLRLTEMADGRVQVEDLGSSNGTFIDGVRIVKKIVSADAVVRMGSSYTFRVGDAMKGHGGARPKEAVYTAEERQRFNGLEKAYNDYHGALVALQKDNARKGFMRMLPMSIIGLASLLASLVPGIGDVARPLIICVGVGISGMLMYRAYNASTDLPERMEALRRQFQIDYVCPHCKNFFGDIPFEGIRNKGKCSFCKTKFTH